MVKDWTIPNIDLDEEKRDKILKLKCIVDRLTSNLKSGMEKLCPIVTINRRNKPEPWLSHEDVKKQQEKERNAWLDWKNEVDNSQLKGEFEKEKCKSTKLLNEKKGKIIRQKIIEEGNENTKSLWRKVKEVLNWKEGGPPTELRNAAGKLETNPSLVADIFHDALENKVNTITDYLSSFEETIEEEERALRDAGIRQGNEEFNFKKVSLDLKKWKMFCRISQGRLVLETTRYHTLELRNLC